MGKASKFFKSLLGFKTTAATTTQRERSDANKQAKRRRWSFVKSHREEDPPSLRSKSKSIGGSSLYHHVNNSTENNEDPNKHAIALAAATAAVVDAAAKAAAEVVRMTSSRTTSYGVPEELAAIKIQSCFRAYLARRALRALKALVRLQAVVRGHILRKQTTDMMRRLQALIRAQARARALRSQIHVSDSTNNSHFHHHDPPTPEKIEHFPRTKHDYRSLSRRNGSKSYARSILGQERMIFDVSNDHENDKNVEVDTGELHVMNKGRKLFQQDQMISFGYSHSLTTSKGSTAQPTSSSPCASCEVNSFDDLTRGGVSTPIKSECSRSYVSGFSDYPNYMANTESSRAKVRSISAPRLRPPFEVSNPTKKDSGYKNTWGPTLRDSFAKKAYPGSGRLGMRVYDMGESEYCVGYWI